MKRNNRNAGNGSRWMAVFLSCAITVASIAAPISVSAEEVNPETAAAEMTEEFAPEFVDEVSDSARVEEAEDEELADDLEIAAEEPVEFYQSEEIDDVTVTVSADAGVFPEEATLSVSEVESEVEEAIADNVDAARDEEVHVAKSYTFDIKVLDAEGNELQPDTTKGQVQVSFAAEEVKNENLEVEVYHISDEILEDDEKSAEKLDSEIETVDGEEMVVAETTGFSYYTVEFTYNNLQYVMSGDSSIPLADILAEVELTGTVTNAVSSNPELFSVDQENGVWMVHANQAFSSEEWLKVTIGEIEYTIQVTDDATSMEGTAITADTSDLTDDKYYLNSNVTLNNILNVTGNNATGNNVTLDLNGYVLKLSPDNQGIRVTGNLTIEDSNTGNQTHKFIKREKDAWEWNETDGTVEIVGGVITGANNTSTTDYGGAFAIKAANASITMNGGAIIGNRVAPATALESRFASGGAAVMIPSGYSTGKFTMNGGLIQGNATIATGNVVQGGAIWSYGTVEIKGKSQIKDNYAVSNTYGRGGAIYMQGEASKLTINGSPDISNNYANYRGGAIYFNNGSLDDRSLEITGGKFEKNSSQYGGAIDILSGTANISDVTFVENKAVTSGGAIYSESSSAITIKNSTIKDCTAKVAGGAVANKAGTVTVLNSTIQNCKATNENGYTYGGAIINGDSYVSSYGTGNTRSGTGTVVIKENSKIIGCSAEEGGGVYNYSYNAQNSEQANLIISDSFIESCKAEGTSARQGYCYGGGIYNRDGNVQIANTTINDCSSANSGGGIAYDKEISETRINIDIEGTSISNCKSNREGGAIYLGGDSVDVNLDHVDIVECKTQGDGAALYDRTSYSSTNSTETNSKIEISNSRIEGCESGSDNWEGSVGVIRSDNSAIIFKDTSITNCKAKKSSALIYLANGYASLVLDNFTMTGCEADQSSMSSGLIFTSTTETLKNRVIIKDNTATYNGKTYKRNLHVAETGWSAPALSVTTVDATGLTAGSDIGIFHTGKFERNDATGNYGRFLKEGVLVSTGITEETASYFHLDDNNGWGMRTDLENGQLLMVAHQHNWNYEVRGNVIAATSCTVETDLIDVNCNISNSAPLPKLTIDASGCAKTYDGRSCTAASVTPSNDWEALTGISAPNETATEGTAQTSTNNWTVKYTGIEGTNYDSTECPSAAGKYEASVSIVVNGHTYTAKDTFQITKGASSVATVPTANSLTYNGTDQDLITAGTSTSGTVKYRIGTTGDWSTTVPTGKAAGTYDVYYKVFGDGNHNDSAETKISNTKILQKTIGELAWSNDSFTYDQQSHVPTAAVRAADICAGDNLTVTVSGAKTDAGSYTATATGITGTGADNYALTSTQNVITHGFSIVAKTVAIEWSNTQFTYDGQSHLPTATVTGVISGDTCSATVSGSQVNANTETVPNYTASVATTALSNNNYRLANEATTTFKIEPKVLTADSVVLSVTDGTYMFKNESITVTGDVTVTDRSAAITPNDYYFEGDESGTAVKSDYKLIVKGKNNYKGNVEVPWKIAYITSDVNVNGITGENGWYVSDVTLQPQTGYTISKDDMNHFEASLVLTENGTKTVAYYLKDTNGYITKKMEKTIKLDKEAPRAEIKVAENSFAGLLNRITFGYFFKNNIEVKITGTDTASGIAQIEYQKVAKYEDYRADGTWTKKSSFLVEPNEKFIVFARVTDNAGNVTTISSDGNVVFTDADAGTTESYIKKSGTDLVTDTKTNENTIAKVTIQKATEGNGVAVAAEPVPTDKCYIDASGKIAFEHGYLDELEAGTYQVTVSYNPYGVPYSEDYDKTNKVTATDSVITLTVGRATGNVTITNDISKAFDATPVQAPTYTKLSNENVIIRYKKKGADDSTYTETAPSKAGEYTVQVIAPADKYYAEAKEKKDFTIAKIDPILSVSAIVDKTYGDQSFALEVTNKSESEPTFTSSNDQVVAVDKKGVVTPVGAGKASITVALAESTNYNAKSVTVDLTVEKKNATLTVTTMSYEVTYGDADFTIADITREGESKIAFTNSDDSVATVDQNGKVVIQKVGETTITLSMKDSANYNAVATKVTVKVVPKKITVQADGKKITYGDPEAALSYTATGLVGEDQLTDISLARAEGTTVGVYEITASQKDGANRNYDITFQKGAYMIEPKSIKNAVVTLGDKLTANGSMQKQVIEAVALDGEKVTYTVTDDSAAKAGTYAMKITGTGNFKDTIEKTFVVGDPENPANQNSVKVEAVVAPKAPEMEMQTPKAELMNMLMTADEAAEVADGAELSIWLEVEDVSDTITETSKKQMAAGTAGYTIGNYIDISLFKKLSTESEKTRITETAKPLKISVKIPKDLLNTDSNKTRTYAIVRNHDGKVEILPTTFDAKSGTLTFETNQFSDYAIIYKDTDNLKAVPAQSTNPTSQNVPKTGDDFHAGTWMLLLMLGLAGLVGAVSYKKKVVGNKNI